MAARLPHDYPFRFVDTVLDGGPAGVPANSSDWKGRVVARVSGNGRAAMGERWQSPLLLAEALAQAALLLAGQDSETGRRGFLAGLDSFEFLRSPQAGETLDISVRLKAHFGMIVKFEGEVRCGDETLARGAVLVREGERSPTGQVT